MGSGGETTRAESQEVNKAKDNLELAHARTSRAQSDAGTNPICPRGQRYVEMMLQFSLLADRGMMHPQDSPPPRAQSAESERSMR